MVKILKKTTKMRRDTIVRKCIICGDEFVITNPRQKSCSSICSRKRNLTLQKLRSKKWAKEKNTRKNLLSSKLRIKYRKILSDWYVRSLLVDAGIVNPSKEVIEQRKLQIQIRRKIKEITNETRKTKSL